VSVTFIPSLRTRAHLFCSFFRCCHLFPHSRDLPYSPQVRPLSISYGTLADGLTRFRLKKRDRIRHSIRSFSTFRHNCTSPHRRPPIYQYLATPLPERRLFLRNSRLCLGFERNRGGFTFGEESNTKLFLTALNRSRYPSQFVVSPLLSYSSVVQSRFFDKKRIAEVQ